MISRTFPAKKMLNLITRFWASSVENSEAPKGKSYRMPEMKKEPSSEVQAGNEDKSYRMPTEEVLLYPFINKGLSGLRFRFGCTVIVCYCTWTSSGWQLLSCFSSPTQQPSFLWSTWSGTTHVRPWWFRVHDLPGQFADHDRSWDLRYLKCELVFFSWIFNKKHNKYIIERVYLYNSNKIEFSFSNKIRRKLKDTEDFHMFLCPEDLKTPPHNEDGSLAWGQKGAKFP